MPKPSKSDLLYQVPRYLGLEKAEKTGADLWDLRLGFSPRTRVSLEVDREGMELIKYCFSPRSLHDIAGFAKTSVAHARKLVNSFISAKVLSRVPASTPEKLKRYDRHALFYDLVGQDPRAVQEKLGETRIALIGMGGIGNWVALNLIGAGLKELRLIDFDTVELTNLTRQVLFSEFDIGASKVKTAARQLQPKNRQTKVRTIEHQVKSTKTLERHLKDVDFVILSADRPPQIHDWVDEICIRKGIPYLNIGYRDADGVLGPLTVRGESSCYQCHKPRPKGDKAKPNLSKPEDIFDGRYQAPSFGPLNALVSTMGSLQVLKHVCGIEDRGNIGVEMSIDPLTLEITRVKYDRDPNCWHCSRPARRASKA